MGSTRNISNKDSESESVIGIAEQKVINFRKKVCTVRLLEIFNIEISSVSASIFFQKKQSHGSCSFKENEEVGKVNLFTDVG